MTNDDLLQRAIAAIKAGDPQFGRELIAQILKADRNNEQAWLWLTQTNISHEEKIKSLQNVLKLNPANQVAKDGLTRLQAAAPMPEPSPDYPPHTTDIQKEQKLPKKTRNIIIAVVASAIAICGICFALVSRSSNNRTAQVNVPSPTETPFPPATQPDSPPTNTPLPTATPDPSPTTTNTAVVSAPGPVTAQVVNIVDGDTIDVLFDGQEFRVRYILIDTPEVSGGVEPFGPEATAANRALVEGQTVTLEKDVSETDRFGRLLRYVYLADGRMVNEELLHQGMATVATFPPDVKYVDRFRAVEAEARTASVGLWAGQVQPAPEPPAAGGNVVISNIFYDGKVAQVESDEYAVITNNGSAAVDLGGWRLNAGTDGQDFSFPSFNLEPGQSCRVYTDQSHPETCGFSFASNKALWRNSGDCGRLYDTAGAMVSERCY